MKLILTIVIYFFTSSFYGQTDSAIVSVDIKAGLYKDFYKSGQIKIEGNYAKVDSIECVNCFDTDQNKKITKAQSVLMRVGEWKEYHANGQIKSHGFYKGIHETYSIHWPKDHGKKGKDYFVPGEYLEEYLKDKTWKYYDEQGQFNREEYFFNGVVADIKHYEK